MLAEVIIPAPLEHQLPVVESPARYKVVRAGRRGGKTVLAEGCAVVGHGPIGDDGEPVFKGIVHDLDVVWVARDYTQAGIMWHEFIRPRFKHVPGVRVNEADRTVTLEGAGTLFVVSAENIASVRGMGKRLGGVIVEEAAWLALAAALRDVILPALMDNEGWLLLISTTNAGTDGGRDANGQPQTPSYFNTICEEIRAGQRSRSWEEFHFTAEDNPEISPSAFADLVAEYPADSPQLQQEVYAALLKAGIGLALAQVSEAKHLVPRYKVPDHWTQFGAFDWGFNHPYAFGWFAVDDDGNVVLIDTVWGYQEQPPQIAKKVAAAVPVASLRYVEGGHDLWQDHKARGERVPTLFEQFVAHGWKLKKANISRVSGLNNLRRYVEWQATEHTPEHEPRFTLMDTAGNRRVLACLTAMQVDPKDVEDALKVDAVSGKGGDDAYDMVRYGLASRPIVPVVKRDPRDVPNDVSPALRFPGGTVPKRRTAQEQYQDVFGGKERASKPTSTPMPRLKSWR